MRILAHLALLTFSWLSATAAHAGETVRVAIGTQDTTINCATGGPLVRELHLLEKYLPKTGKYKDVTYDIHWENQPTGAQLNSRSGQSAEPRVHAARAPGDAAALRRTTGAHSDTPEPSRR